MRERKILALRGLQGSGKTTFAKLLVSAGNRFKRINYDDLRWYDEAGHPVEYVFSRDAENAIKSQALLNAEAYLRAGFSLVIDNTNLSEKELRRWENLAISFDIPFEVLEFDVDIDKCLRRNAEREDWSHVPRAVIEHAALVYHRGIRWRKNKIIAVDIDGTLADDSHRMHFIQPEKLPCPVCREYDCKYDDSSKPKKQWGAFFAAVGDDKPIVHTIQWLHFLRDQGYYIVLVSGRPIDRTGEATVAWLEKHNIPFDRIFMRNTNDFRPSNFVKRDILMHMPVLPEFAIEDRPQDAREYERFGIKVYSVGTGEEF